jgi:hypothetical protein
MSRAETEGSAGCSKSPSGKAAASEGDCRLSGRRLSPSTSGTGTGNAGASPLEPLSDARTPLADFFNTLIGVQ